MIWYGSKDLEPLTQLSIFLMVFRFSELKPSGLPLMNMKRSAGAQQAERERSLKSQSIL